MAKPERRSILQKAPRADGEAAIGVRSGLQRLQAVSGGEEPTDLVAGLAVEMPAEVARTETSPVKVQPAAAHVEVRPAVDVRPVAPPKVVPVTHEVEDRSPRGSGPAAWDGFALPQFRAPSAQFDLDLLLAGPGSITTMHLPQSVALALRQVKFDLDRRGYSVTQSTLVTHALAYAYTHVHSWLEIAPPDGRRKDAETNLSVNGRRTSFGLTQGIRDASDQLLWYAAITMGERAPAKITLQATALAWGLSRMSDWLDGAIVRPIVVRESKKRGSV